MNISFDSAKSERNERERGLTFSLVGQLDWSGAVIEVVYSSTLGHLIQ